MLLTKKHISQELLALYLKVAYFQIIPATNTSILLHNFIGIFYSSSFNTMLLHCKRKSN